MAPFAAEAMPSVGPVAAVRHALACSEASAKQAVRTGLKMALLRLHPHARQADAVVKRHALPRAPPLVIHGSADS